MEQYIQLFLAFERQTHYGRAWRIFREYVSTMTNAQIDEVLKYKNQMTKTSVELLLNRQSKLALLS